MQKKTSRIAQKDKNEDNRYDETEKDLNSEEDIETQAKFQVSQLQLQKMVQNKEQLFDKIKQLMDESISLIDRSLYQESNFFLEQAEEIIEFAANRGKQIDRNLIITVLYNRACSYQGLWKLDKCNKYIDAVIYNLESSLSNEMNSNSDKSSNEKLAYKLRRHSKAIETAKKAIKILEELFNQLLSACKEKSQQSENMATQVITCQRIKQQLDKKSASESKSPIKPSSAKHMNQKQSDQSNGDNEMNKTAPNICESEKQFFAQQKSVAKEEVIFSRTIPTAGFSFLQKFEQKGMFNVNIGTQDCGELKNARQSIYFWKSNPENNEKNMRQELNVPIKNQEEDNRNIIGIQNGQEWIEQFNIGSIMHMTSISFEEFSVFDDILFELSKKQLVEKMLFLSICFFTIATEIRFVELDLQKSLAKGQQYDLMKQEAYQQSEIYHLKSIEIVCQAVTCYSPYITHLINSYHKHYNASLDMIEEEVSILSQCSHTEEQLAKYKEYSNNKADHPDLIETSDTSGYQRNNEDILPKELTNGGNKLYAPEKYTYSSKQTELASKNSNSYNGQTKNNQNVPLNDPKYRKRSPQNGHTAVTGLEQVQGSGGDYIGQKRPASQHATSMETSDGVPTIQTIKINKNNPAFQKKSPQQIDLESINSSFGNNSSNPIGSGLGSGKNLRDAQQQGSSVRKQSPVNTSDDSRKGVRQKENQEIKYSQNNMNQFQILRNYATQNGSPRSNQSQIKTIFQGKGSPNSSQTSVQNPQQYSPQNLTQQQMQFSQNQQILQANLQNNQQSSSPLSSQQQVQYQPIGSQTQQFSPQSIQQQQQQMQYLQYQQQQSLSQQQQGQYLKTITNNGMKPSSTIPNQSSMALSQSQQIMQGQINSQPLMAKSLSNSAVQLQLQNQTILQKGMRNNFNEQDFRIQTSDRSPDDKSGSSTHRSLTGQNGKSIPSSSPDQKQQSSLSKSSSSQRSIQNANGGKQQMGTSPQMATQPQSHLKQMAPTVQTYKNAKPGELNAPPQKQGHNFLQQFDYLNTKTSGFSPVGSKEFSNSQVINSARGSPPNTANNNGMKGIPKLDFNQIQNPSAIKPDENVRFFSARDHSAKKINNFVTKA